MSRWSDTAAASTAGLTGGGYQGPRTPNKELEVRARPGKYLVELWTNFGESVATIHGGHVSALRATMEDALALLRMPEPEWPPAPSGPAPATARYINARPIRAQQAVGLYEEGVLLHTLSIPGCMQAALDLRYASTQLVPPRTGTTLEPSTVSPSQVASAGTIRFRATRNTAVTHGW
ncbi:hypothetical protein [Amycolatopsis magusensis]|uniref:hypothetical protein n=1 Tax=Amycolatopsis magusensis TaxID=882444 RepID=UPI00379A3A2E